MNVGDVPLLRVVWNSGADDHVFDGLLLAGPVLLCVLALVGRTPITTAIAAGYLVTFVGYTLYKANRSEAINRR